MDLCVREQSTTVGEAWLLLYDLSNHIKSIVKKRETDGRRQKEGRGVGVVGRRDGTKCSIPFSFVFSLDTSPWDGATHIWSGSSTLIKPSRQIS